MVKLPFLSPTSIVLKTTEIELKNGTSKDAPLRTRGYIDAATTITAKHNFFDMVLNSLYCVYQRSKKHYITGGYHGDNGIKGQLDSNQI